MNIIRSQGLILDPITDSISFAGAAEVSEVLDWTGAKLKLVRETTVFQRTAKLVKCKLTDAAGKKIPGRRDIICDVAGISMAMATDEDGLCQIYLPNAAAEDKSFDRDFVIGDAEPISNYCRLQKEHISALEAKRGPPKKLSKEELKQVRKEIKQAVGKTVPKKWLSKYVKLLLSFEDIVSTDKHDLGLSDTVIHDIKLRDKEPVYTQQYRLPLDQLELIKEHIIAWLRSGVIERTKSRYNSPVFCVPKKEGHGIRVVLDYRRLNAKTLPDKYSIRTIEQCIEEVGRMDSKVFSCIDLRSGFWQMKLDEDSRKYTAFTYPGEGQFQFRTAPMGLMGSPASFARLMDLIMGDLENVITYIDDCLIHSKDHDGHLKHLELALGRLRKHKLKINVSKCIFGSTEVQYLGHTLSEEGVKPGKDKAAAIAECKAPTDVKQVKSFAGLCNYFRGYVQNFARIAAPLFALTRKDSDWKGGELPQPARRAFEFLRKKIAEMPVLRYPTRNGKYHLYTDGALGDASNEGGLGAVLYQEDAEGRKHPVGYASRRLIKHEKNYPAFLLEMQAAIYGMEFFDTYLNGRKFYLYSDHKPLCRLNTVHAKTLNRLQLKMLEMFPEIRYVKGEENTVADFLSRYQGLGVAQIDASPFRLRVLQDQDPDLGDIKEKIRTVLKDKGGETDGTLVNFRGLSRPATIIDDILLVKDTDRHGVLKDGSLRIAVPMCMRKELIQEAHNSQIAGHSGIFKTMERLRREFWWPSMDAQVTEHIKKCTACQATTNKGTRPGPPLEQLPIPQGPNWRVHIDLFGPLKKSEKGNNYVLVMTDAFSKIVQLRSIAGKEATTVAQAVMDGWMYTFGVPKMIVSDQGTEFCNELQKAIWTKLQIEHKVTTPYHPQTNSQAEVFNKTLAHYLRTVIQEAEASTLDWEMYLMPLMFSHNTAVHKSTKVSPFYTTFGYDPRVPLWDTGNIFDKDFGNNKLCDKYAELHQAQRLARKVVLQNSQHAKEEQARQHDRDDTAEFPQYEAGDLVWVKVVEQYLPNNKRNNKKLAPKWEEGTIVSRTGFATYVVCRDNRSRKKQATLNASRLKPRFIDTPVPEDTDEQSSVSEEEEDPTPVHEDSEQEEEPTPVPTQHESESEQEEEEEEQQQQPRPATPVPTYTGPTTRARGRQQVHATKVIDLDNISPDELFFLLNNGYSLLSNGNGRTTATTTAAPPPAAPARRARAPRQRSHSMTTRATWKAAGPAARTRCKSKQRESVRALQTSDIDNLDPDKLFHLLNNGYALLSSGGNGRAAAPTAAAAAPRAPAARRTAPTRRTPPRTRSRSRSAATSTAPPPPPPPPPSTSIACNLQDIQTSVRATAKKSGAKRALKNIKNFLSPGTKEAGAQSNHPKGLRQNIRGPAEAEEGPAATE
jgi:hypothetical protein